MAFNLSTSEITIIEDVLSVGMSAGMLVWLVVG